MRQINDHDKRRILKILLKHENVLLQNEFLDAKQLIYKNGEFIIDHWSPRENLTYDQDSISLEEAWEIAEKHSLYLEETIEKYFRSKGQSDNNRSGKRD